MPIARFSSRPLVVAWLAFVGALALTLASLFDLSFQIVELHAAQKPADTPTVAKIAWAVPTSTPTPTDTPTSTNTPTRKPTATSTRTVTPTRRPTFTPTASRAAILVLAAKATGTLTAVPQSPTASVTPPAIIGGSYGLVSVLSSGGKDQARPADVNLSVRGFVPVTSTRGLVDYMGEADAAAPQLAGVFSDNRSPVFLATYQLYEWNEGCDCRGPLMSDYDVSVVSLAANQGEPVRVPESGYEIASGFEVLVVYVDPERIVLKYTRRDGVIDGYALYLEPISVDSNLIALYQQANSAGRGELPALRPAQVFGVAKTNELKLAIRDSGAFLDPRSRKDWWRGR